MGCLRIPLKMEGDSKLSDCLTYPRLSEKKSCRSLLIQHSVSNRIKIEQRISGYEAYLREGNKIIEKAKTMLNRGFGVCSEVL